MIIIKLISCGFLKNLESECSNFYLGGSNKRNEIYYIYIASSGGLFDEPPNYTLRRPCFALHTEDHVWLRFNCQASSRAWFFPPSFSSIMDNTCNIDEKNYVSLNDVLR